jgi:hypothetical protein
VRLDHNNLTALSESVFRPVIQFFVDNGLDTSRISVASSENAIAFIFKSRFLLKFNTSFSLDKDPFDCGVDLACGNEKWLVTNDLLSPYVTGGEYGDDKRTPFASLTQVICACPPAVDISPCGCSFSGGDGQNGKNLAITCFGYKAILDDAAMAEKLAKIPADLYLVDAMDLSDNSLTFVPLALPLYPLLAVLSLAKNKISAVKNTTT